MLRGRGGCYRSLRGSGNLLYAQFSQRGSDWPGARDASDFWSGSGNFELPHSRAILYFADRPHAYSN